MGRKFSIDIINFKEGTKAHNKFNMCPCSSAKDNYFEIVFVYYITTVVFHLGIANTSTKRFGKFYNSAVTCNNMKKNFLPLNYIGHSFNSIKLSTIKSSANYYYSFFNTVQIHFLQRRPLLKGVVKHGIATVRIVSNV